MISYKDCVDLRRRLDENSVIFIKENFPSVINDEGFVIKSGWHLQKWIKENEKKLWRINKLDYMEYVMSKDYYEERLKGKYNKVYVLEMEDSISLVSNKIEGLYEVRCKNYDIYKKDLEEYIRKEIINFINE